MANLNIPQMSESEEMYLITIAQLTERGVESPVPLSLLAEELALMPVSVNQMIHKLDEEGLVSYSPYKGVELLQEGNRLAQRVLRRRRLWETFLVEHLELSAVEADALACRLEHITPQKVAERLFEFLGQPTLSPQGKPIPPSDADIPAEKLIPLSELKVGQSGQIVDIKAEASVCTFLQAEHLTKGVTVTVMGVGDRGAMLLKSDGRQVSLCGEVVEDVFVQEGSIRPVGGSAK